MRGKGNPNGSPADRRAHQLWTASRAFDFVCSVHGIEGTQEYVSYSTHASMFVRSVAALLTSKVVLAPEVFLEHHMTNGLTVELSREGAMTPDMLCDTLIDIAQGNTPPYRPMEEYMYIGGVNADQATRLNLQREYHNFEPLTDHDNQRIIGDLGYPEDLYYAIGWSADRYEIRTGNRGEFMIRNH